jgi:hypothetical protein
MEAGYQRAHESLVSKKTHALSTEWRDRIDPDNCSSRWTRLVTEGSINTRWSLNT